MVERKTGNLYTKTSFRNGGRKAGTGMLYDDYEDESGNESYCEYSPVRFPNDHIKPEELNGEVVIVQKGKTNGKE